MKAFIIAGGEGTRLKPYTYSTPKPLLPLGCKPILQYTFENLKRFGIKDYVITLRYLHEQISSYFGDGSKFGVKIEYAVEKEVRNTAGSILPYKGKVKDTFFVLMGDHLTNIDLEDMLKQHKKSGALATIALYKDRTHLEYGVASVEGTKVTGFREKPVIDSLYNTAIYVFEPEVFDYIKEGEDFAKNVIPRLIKEGKKVEGYIFDDVWFDVGNVSDYQKLDELMKVIRLAKDLEQ